MAVSFDAPDLLDLLEQSSLEAFDREHFGLIVMDRQGDVLWYNLAESARSGLEADKVVGRNFFKSVGPCTDNHLIAHRYSSKLDLDETIDFVFTLRMRLMPVRLRLMARSGSARQYLAVEDRA